MHIHPHDMFPFLGPVPGKAVAQAEGVARKEADAREFPNPRLGQHFGALGFGALEFRGFGLLRLLRLHVAKASACRFFSEGALHGGSQSSSAPVGRMWGPEWLG